MAGPEAGVRQLVQGQVIHRGGGQVPAVLHPRGWVRELGGAQGADPPALALPIRLVHQEPHPQRAPEAHRDAHQPRGEGV